MITIPARDRAETTIQRAMWLSSLVSGVSFGTSYSLSKYEVIALIVLLFHTARNEFFNSFINRVILYNDRVIILYNTNKRETKQLKKSEILEIESGEKPDEIKENSPEPEQFKRVLFV